MRVGIRIHASQTNPDHEAMTAPKKPVPMKTTKMWADVNRDGTIVFVSRWKGNLELIRGGGRIVRVVVTEVEK